MWFSNKPIIALAPMADMTDSPFCRVCREIAGDNFVIFREMVSAEAIIRGNEKTLKMCQFNEIERPIVIQLFGAEAEKLALAAKIVVEKFHPDGIDINMGCPVPKIAQKSNSGAKLMKDPERAVSIVRALKNANLDVPVSVKTRLGWNKDDEILDFALRLEEAGIDAITIHGRTKIQGYTGKANWERIAEVKKKLSIPVIANGDIKNVGDIKQCLAVTGADGVMIGRGALGNPWIFGLRITDNPDLRMTRITDNPDIQIIKEVVLRHAELHLAHYGEKFGLNTFRKHLLYYFKGDRAKEISDIKKLRSELVKVVTLADLKKVLKLF